MRTRTIALLVAGIALAGCGSNRKTFANQAPPATTVNLTVYVDNARVSVSPDKVGAGPVTFIVTNHASSSESLLIESTGSGSPQPLANTGPINPQGTATVSVDLNQQGQYTVATGHGSGTEASSVTPSGPIAPATITIGPPRPNSRGDLNVP